MNDISVSAVIRRYDNNINAVSLVSLSERCAVFHISTRRKRDNICCFSGHAVYLNPVDDSQADVMGEAIEFMGLPKSWLLYGQDDRYGVLVTIVDGDGWQCVATTEAASLPIDSAHPD